MNMNSIWIYILIIISLISCTARSPDQGNCSPDGQVCVEISANEPILYGSPVVVTITVSSEKDISELGVSINYDEGIIIESIENWEPNLQNPIIYSGGASWVVPINANQTLNFTRTLYLPPREGAFTIISAITDQQSFRASNLLGIVMTTQGGTVYLANTPAPHNSDPLHTIAPNMLSTMLAMPTTTPWSTITPQLTSTATPPAYPPPTSPPGEGPGTPYP